VGLTFGEMSALFSLKDKHGGMDKHGGKKEKR